MKTDEVFAFAAEREKVRLRKEAGFPWPWTEDKILQSYKFTNVCREHDATSRELIARQYVPNAHANPKDILLNCALNRYFGRWEFADARGWVTYDSYDPDALLDLAEQRRAEKKPVFTGAYVITNGGISAPKEWVVLRHYIDSLYDQIPVLVEKAQMTRSWEQVSKLMSRIEGFGGSGFMTKETLVDTTYTHFWGDNYPAGAVDGRPAILSIPDDWLTWTPVGPGARRGAARVLGHDDLWSVEAQSIRRNTDQCVQVIRHLCSHSTAALGFYLAPHDIQFVLCEFDKYERVRLGQGEPKATYKRR